MSDIVHARVDGELVLLELEPRPLERLRRFFSLPNPKYVQLKRFSRGTEINEPRRVDALIEMPDGSAHLPRGTIRKVKELLALDAYTLKVVDDQRSSGTELENSWALDAPETRDYQLDGVVKWKAATQGLIILPPGTGKTRLAVAAIVDCPVTTLVIVPTGDIADQWVETLVSVGIVAGRVGDGKDERFFEVVVAIVNSVALILAQTPEWGQRFGQVICDEAHRVTSVTYQRILRALPAKRRLALTATPEREDGLEPLINWTFGETLLEKRIPEMIRLGWLQPSIIELVETGWEWSFTGKDEKKKLPALEAALVEDVARNMLVTNRVVKEAVAKHTCLILVSRKKHAAMLTELLIARGVEAKELSGRVSKGKRKATLGDLRDGTLGVGVATMSLLSEGVDLPRLDFIALAAPQRAKGATLQRLGRLLRLFPGKKPVLVDYVDSKVPTLASRASARKKVFRSTGLLH